MIRSGFMVFSRSYTAKVEDRNKVAQKDKRNCDETLSPDTSIAKWHIFCKRFCNRGENKL